MRFFDKLFDVIIDGSFLTLKKDSAYDNYYFMIELKKCKENFHISKFFITASRQKLGTILENYCALKIKEGLKNFNLNLLKDFL